MKYTLKNTNGDVVEVEAENEPQARRRAMTKLWGKDPQMIGTPAVSMGMWTGDGLDLVEVKK